MTFVTLATIATMLADVTVKRGGGGIVLIVLFWILLLLWAVAGFGPPESNWSKLGSRWIPIILFAILGFWITGNPVTQ